MHVLPLLALAAVASAPTDPVAVSNANMAATCQWPTVVTYRGGTYKCSGTLIHPRVVVTAAHCLDPGVRPNVRFGERFQPDAFLRETERCEVYPQYLETQAPSDDLAYCLLAEPVESIPPTPLVMGCEADAWLHEGRPAVIVGFGIEDVDGQFGIKRYAFTELASDLRSDGTIWVGDAVVNGCFGDSGGPAFVQSPEGTWHVVGVLGYGPACGSGPVLFRTLVDRITWLENAVGLDVSPCHDPEGRWDPGPACGPIATDPLAQGLEWADKCEGAVATAPSCPSTPDDAAADTDADTGRGTDTHDGASGATGAMSGTALDTEAATLDPNASGCECRATPGSDRSSMLLALFFVGWRRGRR